MLALLIGLGVWWIVATLAVLWWILGRGDTPRYPEGRTYRRGDR